MEYDVIIVGAGFAGATIAERFANDNKKVLVLEKRNHIAGNMYDYIDENGVLVHQYGPHLLHTNQSDVVLYLSNFTEWFEYEHRVLGYVNGKLVPIPFNLTSIEECFEENVATELKNALIDEYGMEKKVPILELKQSKNDKVKELADFIYEKVFKHYTMKQWDLTPEQIDPGVTKRVPVFVSRDDRYFTDEYQIMPKYGYTKLFEKMFDNENIDVILNVEALSKIEILEDGKKVLFNGEEFNGKLVYTGAIDELLDFKYGELPYRSLEFDFRTEDKVNFQPTGTVNYPTPKEEHAYTRITEFKHMTLEDKSQAKTTVIEEFPYAYERNGEKGNVPYYPIFTEDNQNAYDKYRAIVDSFDNVFVLGRLAEYKYYNMDAMIARALELYDEIK